MEEFRCIIIWSNFFGLIINFIGSIFISFGLFVSKKKALELGVSRWAGNSDEENLKLPLVQSFLIQSRNAKFGIILLAIGFFFQIIGNLPYSILK